MSHQHALRQHALRLLTSSIVDAGQSNSLLRACLQGEEATLDVQGVRDRVLRITSIPQIVRTDDGVGSDAALRWLIGMSLLDCSIAKFIFPNSSITSKFATIVVSGNQSDICAIRSIR